MNRTIKGATVKRCHYDSHNQLHQHLDDFISAYNFGRRLKTLKGLTPYEFISKIWTTEPKRFTLNTIHQMPALNTQARSVERGATDFKSCLRSLHRRLSNSRLGEGQAALEILKLDERTDADFKL